MGENARMYNWMIQGQLCFGQSPYQHHLALPYHITAIQHTLFKPPLIMDLPCARNNVVLIIYVFRTYTE